MSRLFWVEMERTPRRRGALPERQVAEIELLDEEHVLEKIATKDFLTNLPEPMRELKITIQVFQP